MALVDLLDKIQSFDYNQVGKPQSYKANPQDLNNVTGQQTFDRPIREPLPIQEQLLGYGLRNGSSFLQGENRGFDFFDNSFAQGFEVNKVDKETDFLFIEGNQSSFIPSANDSVWPGPVNFFDKDDEHSFVNGFVLNKGLTGNGPGSTDFKFLNADGRTYTVKPQLNDFGGNTYKWTAWNIPSGVNFFFGNDRVDDVATGFTPNVQGTQFVNINDEGSIFDYIPKIKDTDYSWVDKNTPYSANFFSDTQVPGFSQEMQTSTLFHVPAVSSKVIANSIEGGQYNSNSYLWSTAYFDYLNNLEFLDISNVGSLTDPIQFQSRLTIPDTSLYGGIEYRRQAGRIENMDIGDSNFVTTNDSGDATEVNFVRDQAVSVSRDSEGTNLTIPNTTRTSMQYPNSYTGKQITQEGLILENGFEGIDEEVLVKPNRLKEFADDYFKGENKSMFIAVGDDGKVIGANKTQFKFLSPKDQGIKGVDTYTNYIQEMSPGKNQPFIVRKIDDHWGTSDDGSGNFIGEFLGGFVRTTGSPNDSIMGRLGRELADVQRKGKWLLSTDGLAFGLTQFALQAQNRTIETRFWNPLSLASNDFLHIKRHIGGLTYLEAMDDPISALKEKLPSFLKRFLKDPEKGNTAPDGRIANQSKWRSNIKSPEQLLAPGTEGGAGTDPTQFLNNQKDKLLSKFSIASSNPNHWFRLKFPVDPYGGPEGSDEGVDALENRLLSGVSARTTHTFSEKKLDRQGMDYRYLSYGQIKTVASDTNKSHEYETLIYQDTDNEMNSYRGNSPGQANAWSKDKTAGALKTATESVQELSTKNISNIVRNSNAQGNLGDDVNALSYSDYDEDDELDWVQLSFATQQTLENKTQTKHLQFRASINSVNESVTPEYNEQKYLGRPDKYYTYSGVDRDINIDFTLYPKTATEFPFLTEKLNYLVGLCYPEYNTSGFMIAPYTRFTLGNMFDDAPGYISSLQVNVQDNTTWEFDMFQFPKHITCALTFRYIGKYLPHKFGKHYDLPWLGVDTTNPANLGSTLSNVDHSVNRVNSGGAIGLSPSGPELTKLQEKLEVNVPNLSTVSVPAEPAAPEAAD